jgi:hypothetical protein
MYEKGTHQSRASLPRSRLRGSYAIAQAASLQLPIAVAWVSVQIRLFGICTHSVFMAGFLRVHRFPLQIFIAQADHSGRAV